MRAVRCNHRPYPVKPDPERPEHLKTRPCVRAEEANQQMLWPIGDSTCPLRFFGSQANGPTCSGRQVICLIRDSAHAHLPLVAAVATS